MPKINCREHKVYYNEKHARNDLEKLMLRAANSGDKTWRNLNVYKCGDHLHVGRSRHKQKFTKDFERFLDARYQATAWNQEAFLIAKRIAEDYIARNLQPRNLQPLA
jgi:hypothetical protein